MFGVLFYMILFQHNAVIIFNEHERDKIIELATPFDLGFYQFIQVPSFSDEYDMTLIELLLDKCPWLKMIDQNGKTSLMYAAEQGHVSCLKALIQHRVDVNITDKLGKSALIYAAMGGHASCLDVLVKHKADIDTSSEIVRSQTHDLKRF
jgi:hypothetical protein